MFGFGKVENTIFSIKRVGAPPLPPPFYFLPQMCKTYYPTDYIYQATGKNRLLLPE